MEEINFSIVIVTYNRLDLLKECLDNVLAQEYSAKNILVINNNSTDGTMDFLNSLDKRNGQIIIYHCENNLGGAGGFSIGIQQAVLLSNDWILLIDDDAMINTTFLKNIAGSIKSHNDIQAFAGVVETNQAIDTLHRRRIENKNTLSMTNIQLNEYNNNNEFEVDIASFCGLVFNKTLVKKIGIPLSEFFIWNDDVEYSLRIRSVTKILNVNSARINHKIHISINSDEKNTWKHYYGIRNMVYLLKIHGTTYGLFIYSLKVLKNILKNIFICIYKLDKHYYYNAIQYYKAFWDGLTNRLGKNVMYLP
ncbi:MAG: hypothetical protein K0R54_4264 [Clostridiaceae bacterium]|jgi:GT2 family glycosyltransferase|nr:hypothetical protein [Clostridiaceae bacterium]